MQQGSMHSGSNKLTCKLAISERPERFQMMLAGGFASASQRSTNESLPSSRSICGAPSIRMVGASVLDTHHRSMKREIVGRLFSIFQWNAQFGSTK